MSRDTLRGEVVGLREDIDAGFDQIIETIEDDSADEGVVDVLDDLSDSVVVGAAIVGTGLIVAGFAIAAAVATASARVSIARDGTHEKSDENANKSSLINSILRLQKRYPYLTFRFILDRAVVKGATLLERRDALNELIEETIVTEYRFRSKRALKIDPNSQGLALYLNKKNDSDSNVHDMTCHQLTGHADLRGEREQEENNSDESVSKGSDEISPSALTPDVESANSEAEDVDAFGDDEIAYLESDIDDEDLSF